jgi:predicted protein tyrosine phosphatase
LKKIGTPAAFAALQQNSVEADSSARDEKQTSPQTIITEVQSDKLPKLLIASCAEAGEHILCKKRGLLIKHLISIGSQGAPLPQGFSQVPHRLRLEFNDIHAPDNDPELVLPTFQDILKVIDFVSSVSQFDGHLLIHCHAGISRSSAVALTVCAHILGAGKEQEALNYILAARPQARPNWWIVELADEALNRDGRLVRALETSGIYPGID